MAVPMPDAGEDHRIKRTAPKLIKREIGIFADMDIRAGIETQQHIAKHDRLVTNDQDMGIANIRFRRVDFGKINTVTFRRMDAAGQFLLHITKADKGADTGQQFQITKAGADCLNTATDIRRPDQQQRKIPLRRQMGQLLHIHIGRIILSVEYD